MENSPIPYNQVFPPLDIFSHLKKYELNRIQSLYDFSNLFKSRTNADFIYSIKLEQLSSTPLPKVPKSSLTEQMMHYVSQTYGKTAEFVKTTAQYNRDQINIQLQKLINDEFKYFQLQMGNLQEKCLKLKHLETQKRKYDTDRFDLKLKMDRMIRQEREQREERERKGNKKGIFFRGQSSTQRHQAFLKQLGIIREKQHNAEAQYQELFKESLNKREDFFKDLELFTVKAESNENTRWQKIMELVETQMAHSLELVEKLRSSLEEGLNKFKVRMEQTQQFNAEHSSSEAPKAYRDFKMTIINQEDKITQDKANFYRHSSLSNTNPSIVMPALTEELLQESKDQRRRTMAQNDGNIKLSLTPEQHEMNQLVAGFWEGVMSPSEKESLKKIISSLAGRQRLLMALNKRRGMNKINKKGFSILGDITSFFLDKNHQHFMNGPETEKPEASRQFLNILLLVQTFQLADGENKLLQQFVKEHRIWSNFSIWSYSIKCENVTYSLDKIDQHLMTKQGLAADEIVLIQLINFTVSMFFFVKPDTVKDFICQVANSYKMNEKKFQSLMVSGESFQEQFRRLRMKATKIHRNSAIWRDEILQEVKQIESRRGSVLETDATTY